MKRHKQDVIRWVPVREVWRKSRLTVVLAVVLTVLFSILAFGCVMDRIVSPEEFCGRMEGWVWTDGQCVRVP